MKQHFLMGYCSPYLTPMVLLLYQRIIYPFPLLKKQIIQS
jgi:hypothetical protein